MSKEKYEIVFEVLHYLACESTLMTIEYIQKNIDTDRYHIVVTDNASPDRSGDLLMSKYADNEYVTVIKNHSNSGFTRGNNYGISYIREHYDTDFVVVMNNDVMLIETALVRKLRKYLDRTGFALAGPNVVDKSGKPSNPVSYELPSDKTINERIEGPEKLLKYDRYGLMGVYNKLAYTSFRIKRFLRGDSRKRFVFDEKENIVLHGCMWIFSSGFFGHYQGLADKEYMYGEEETLQLCIKAAGLKSVYMPDVTVLHLHRKSSSDAFKNVKEQTRFVARNQKESWKEYLRLRDRLENVKNEEF